VAAVVALLPPPDAGVDEAAVLLPPPDAGVDEAAVLLPEDGVDDAGATVLLPEAAVVGAAVLEPPFLVTGGIHSIPHPLKQHFASSLQSLSVLHSSSWSPLQIGRAK
jgi:hypothetical protein